MGRLLRIAAREYFSYLKTPGFWLSLLIAPVAGAIGGYGPILADKSAPVRTLAIADLTATHTGPQMAAMVRQKADPHTVRLVAPPPEAAEAATPDTADAVLKPYVAGDRLLADGSRLDAAVVLSGTADALHADLWTREIGDRTLTTLVREAGAGVMRKERLAAAGIDERTLTTIDAVTPDVREFSPKAAAGRVSMKDRLPTFAAFGLAFTLWFMILTGAGILLNSVIEEKSNRVLEVLLSSASVPEILGGKILGVAGLAATVLGGLGHGGANRPLPLRPGGSSCRPRLGHPQQRPSDRVRRLFRAGIPDVCVHLRGGGGLLRNPPRGANPCGADDADPRHPDDLPLQRH